MRRASLTHQAQTGTGVANRVPATEKICTVPWTNTLSGNNGKGTSTSTNNAQLTIDLQSRLDDDTCTIVQLPFGRAQSPVLSTLNAQHAHVPVSSCSPTSASHHHT